MADNKTTEPKFQMDRAKAVPALIGNHEDFLIVSGLAGTSKDMASLTGDAANLYTMAGAMGASTAMGLGLALAQPDKRVLVITGDGELMMNIGTLATISVLNPSNLSIVCVDNGHYGETGYQKSHSSLGVDIEQMAIGAGLKMTCSIEREEDIAEGARLLHETNGTSFVLLRVSIKEPPAVKRLLDPAACRTRFRSALLGHA
jgi:thiamine pyrophosphate-dependent acetolactate synthase large subunit-like protein